MKATMKLIPAIATIFLAAWTAAHAGVIQEVMSGPPEIQKGERLYIRFRISQPAAVKVNILNSDLTRIWTRELPGLTPGTHQIEWDGTDALGQPVPPEAYAWTIEAKTADGTELWEPAGLDSRVMEEITDHRWDPLTRTLSYRLTVPMRMWVRVGIEMGACMRLVAEGQPRPAGA